MVAKLEPIIVIVGETASGKSALALKLAKQFNGEIICADSRTIYKGMDIGTAKPTKQDQTEVEHYLLDILEPGVRYSAAQFKKDCISSIKKISVKGKLPIVVGGTGLYINSVLYDYKFNIEDLPKDQKNPRHLIKNKASQNSKLRPNTLVLGLLCERDQLYKRIEMRYKLMLENGLIEEVEGLVEEFGSSNQALSGLGYKTLVKYINKEIDLDKAMQELIIGDKSLAKRQRTWFKRDKNIIWVKSNQAEFEINNFLKTKYKA